MKTRRQPSAPPNRLRARAEKLLATTRREVAQMPVEDVQKLVHELQVHQIELEMQNDELRQAQQELEIARDRYAGLYNFAPAAYLTLGGQGEILEANLGAGELLGRERGRLIGEKFTHFIAPESQDAFYQLRRRVFGSDARQGVELELVTAPATRRVVQVEAVRDAAGARKQCRLSVTDITGRKQAEDAWRQSEERYRHLFNTLIEGFCIIEMVLDARGRPVDYRFLEVNPEFEKQTGLRHAQGRLVRELVPEHENYWFEIYGRIARTGEPARFENEARALGRWYEVSAFRIGGAGSRKVAVLFSDITERRRAQERIARLDRAKAVLGGVDHAIVHLPDRQQLLEEICRVAVDKGGFKLAWIGMVASDGTVQPVAQAGATGYLKGIRVVARDEPAGGGPVGTAIRENRPVVVEDVERDATMAPWRSRARKFGLRYIAAFPIRIDGTVTGACQFYAPQAGFFDEKELSLLAQVSDDISFALTAMEVLAARRRVEDALTRSEQNLANFFNEAPIGLLWLSAGGVILRANRAQLELLGHAAENCLGHFVVEFCAESAQGLELLRRLAARETVRNFPMAWRCKDGAVRHLLADATSLRSSGGFQYSSVFLRDITDRVRLEREILQAGEREHRRIGQDLHDGLGQLLAGAAYLAGNLRQDLAAKSLPAETRQSRRIQAALNEAIAQARSLARGLHPVAAEPNGLMVALAELAARTRKLFQVGCRFHCRRPVLVQDSAVATHLFRIAQEAVTNAIKHGKPGRVEISLTKLPGRICLAVRDDGSGMAAPPKKPGMGLRIMRYRAGMIGGSLGIQHKPGGGTDVVCTVNLSGSRGPARPPKVAARKKAL